MNSNRTIRGPNEKAIHRLNVYIASYYNHFEFASHGGMYGRRGNYKRQKGIFGYNNELILRNGYEVVHHFAMGKNAFTWNFWHWLIGNPKRVDLSPDFEDLVRSHNEEAIVNLKITAAKIEHAITPVVSIATGILTLGLIAPLWMDLTIEGDVICLNTTTPKQIDPIPE